MKMAGQTDLGEEMRKRYRNPEAAIRTLFPDWTEAEVKRALKLSDMAIDDMDYVRRQGSYRRYARDQGEPEPNGSGEFRASQVGPQSGSNEGQTMDDEGEIEQLCEMLGIDPEREPKAYDWVRRRAMDRRRAAADRRRAEDRRGDGRTARDYPGYGGFDRRGAHDARPRDDFFDRFPETRRIGIQG